MADYLRVLAMRSDGIESDIKFFLTAFILRFGISGSVSRKVKELAVDLNVSDSLVSKASNSLIIKGWLSDSFVPSGRGRPKKCLRMSDMLKARLQGLEEPRVTHQALVRHLIGSSAIHARLPVSLDSCSDKHLRDEKGALERKGSLNVSNKLLLAVLASRADMLGIVRDLGRAELAQLTGLDTLNLKRRIQTLRKLGFIRAYVEGIASSTFSTKINTVYFLNLNHPELAYVGAGHHAFVHQAYILTERNERNHMEVLREEAKYTPKETYGYSSGILSIVANFVSKRQHDPLVNMLQLMLSTYASYILSYHWSDVVEHGKILEISSLRKRIAREFRSHPHSVAEGDQAASSSTKEILADYFYRLAFELAAMYKARFNNLPWLNFADMDFAIPPSFVEDGGYYHISLLARARNLDSTHDCYILTEQRNLTTKIRKLSDEYQFSLEERYDSGLLHKANT